MTLNHEQFGGLALDYNNHRATLAGKPIPVHSASVNANEQTWGASIPLENGHIAEVHQFYNHTDSPMIHMALTDEHGEEGEYHHEGKPVSEYGIKSGEEAHAHLSSWANLPAPPPELLQRNREKLRQQPEWKKRGTL